MLPHGKTKTLHEVFNPILEYKLPDGESDDSEDEPKDSEDDSEYSEDTSKDSED